MVLLTAPVSVVTMRFGKRLEWTAADSARLGDLDFAIEPLAEPDAATQAFRLYEPRGLIDDHGRLFAGHPSFAPRDIFELGIWDGGFEHFRPGASSQWTCGPARPRDGWRTTSGPSATRCASTSATASTSR